MLNGDRFDAAVDVLEYQATDEDAFRDEMDAVQEHMRNEKPYYNMRGHEAGNVFTRSHPPTAAGIVSPESQKNVTGYVFSHNEPASDDADKEFYDYIRFEYQPQRRGKQKKGIMKTEHFKRNGATCSPEALPRNRFKNFQFYDDLLDSLMFHGSDDYLKPLRDAYNQPMIRQYASSD